MSVKLSAHRSHLSSPFLYLLNNFKTVTDSWSMSFQIDAPTVIQVFLFQPFIFVLTNKNMNWTTKVYDIIRTYIDWFLAWPFQVAFCIQLTTKINCIICCHNEDCVWLYCLFVFFSLETSSSQRLFMLLEFLSVEFCYFYRSDVYLTVFFCLSTLGSIHSPFLFLLPCLVLTSNSQV